jgi:hypothetical protein
MEEARGKRPLGSLHNFLESAYVAAVEPESCEVLLAKVQREKPLSRLPVDTNFGNDGKKLKQLKLHDQSVAGLECGPNEKIESCQRYGRIYKRRVQTRFKPRNSGPPGTRWCRMCNDHKPLDAFYANTKRLMCRRHHSLRVNAINDLRVNEFRFEQGKRELRLASIQAMSTLVEAYGVLGYEQGQIDETDIRLMIQSSKLPLDLRPVVTPIDPTAGMWPHNVAIVSQEAFDTLINLYYITNSRAIFVAMAQRCNLLPDTFDTSRPHDPYHDAEYKRVYIDATKLLSAEIAGGMAQTMDQTIMEELNANFKVPW